MNSFSKMMPLLLMLQGCAYFRSTMEQPNWQAFDQKQIQNDIQPLALTKPCVSSEAIRKYFDYYDLNPPGTRHCFGTIVSEGEILAVHVFLPENPRGSLFLLHGYFDHTGTLSKLIHEGIRQGYAVAVWDLQGHGFSSGLRTDTGAFELCARQFTDIVGRASSNLPEPFFLIAHSTGASIAMEYMYNSENCEFDKIVFLPHVGNHLFNHTNLIEN